MMLGGLMGDGGAAVEGHESGGGSSEVGGGASSSMMLPAAEEISELRSGGGGGNRWPRQETLALLKIRSDMDVTFRDSSLKGPLWEEVSRKLAELGFHRSAKKCKEKFENVYKYHKRTKDGRTSKPDGKTYRFFDQLEALENTTPPPPPIPFTPPPPRPQTSTTTAPPVNAMPSSSHHHGVTVSSTSPSPSPTPLSVAPPNAATAVPRAASFPMSTLPFQPPLQPQPINISIPPQNHGFQQQPSSNAHHISPSMLSNSTSSSTSSDEDIQRRRGKKRKWKDYFERLVRDVVHKQEELQKKFLDALEKRERDRIAREEAWKVQEMARMNREHDLLVQERSVAAAKDAAVIAFLQKVTDQHNLQLPVSINNVAPTQQVHENHNQPQKPPPPPAPTATATETPTPTPQPQPQQPHQSSTPAPQTATPTPTVQQSMPPPPQAMAITPTNASKTDNGGDNFLPASSSRWPKAEVQALINLRTSLDIKYQENGPKSPLWEEISAAMRKLGYNRSAKRCKEKWENINKYYKKVKESSKKRPEDSKTCPYFHQLEAIYKDKAKINDLPSSFNPVGSGGYAMMKPGNNSPMVPIMARPEQQWPQQQQHHEAMHDNESDINNEHDDDDEDDDAYDEEEEGGGGFEIMANNNNNSSSNKKQPPNTAE